MRIVSTADPGGANPDLLASSTCFSAVMPVSRAICIVPRANFARSCLPISVSAAATASVSSVADDLRALQSRMVMYTVSTHVRSRLSSWSRLVMVFSSSLDRDAMAPSTVPMEICRSASLIFLSYASRQSRTTSSTGSRMVGAPSPCIRAVRNDCRSRVASATCSLSWLVEDAARLLSSIFWRLVCSTAASACLSAWLSASRYALFAFLSTSGYSESAESVFSRSSSFWFACCVTLSGGGAGGDVDMAEKAGGTCAAKSSAPPPSPPSCCDDDDDLFDPPPPADSSIGPSANGGRHRTPSCFVFFK
mmetsp:Transcript_7881/g.20355  ORF Transcript_7881/g.20355 Transcript_7881/m.20355 type:complete len:306 (+) Transcript_7881:185-1102(+)